MTEQIVILLLAANPDGTACLRVDREIKKIEQGLRLAEQRGCFVFKTCQAVTVPDLRRAMQQHRPQIVHFSGHGEGAAGLCFESEQGKIQFVQDEALAVFFSLFAAEVRCVVLNACYSEVQAEAIARHVDYVIGMSYSITDQAAIAFSVAFYESLGNRESIESAYKFACAEIALLGLKEEHIPKLIRRHAAEERNTVQRIVKSEIEHIQRLVAEDKLEKALTEFLIFAASADAETKQEVIAHQAALAKAGKERRKGLMDTDKEEQVRNKVRYALLELLNEQAERRFEN
jgi:hypothetical protein